jgi:hypothetical protein
MAIHGAYAIKMGVIHKEALESASRMISSGLVQVFTDNISVIRPSVSDIITVYIDVWGVAKKDHVRDEDKHVGFATALAIHSKEYARIGVYEELDLLKNNLTEKIKVYEKEKYKNTYETFAISCELISMAKNPSGSLPSFSSRNQSLLFELDRITPLAEFESI